MKYKAPAVHQAIEVIEMLIESESLTLGQIAEKTEFSKATLLRLLETMESHSWVGKISGGKAYESLVVIRPKNNPAHNSELLIQNIIDELSTKTNHTVEWYLPREKYAEIIQRCEPTDRVVSIRAKLGFRRIYAGELDAVNRVAMASGAIDCRQNEPDTGYSTYKDGKHIHIPIHEAQTLVTQVGDELLTYDHEWNNNGIRRHAIGIKGRNGELAGILAIASSFTPQADKEIEQLNEQLKTYGNRLKKLST
jgi:DNA-binding IclR family transcriptional regulator